MNGALEYSPGNSVLHRLNPMTKLLITVCICAACILADTVTVLVLLLAVDLALAAVGGVLPKAVRILRSLVSLCVFIILLQTVFVRTGRRVFLYMTDDGLLSAAKVALRLIVASLPMGLVLAVTRMTDLANALVSVAHMPYKYAFTLTSAFRFIPVLTRELREIMEAQTARGVPFDTKNPLKKLSLVLPLCAPLLITSVRRTDDAAVAAQLRGFELRRRDSGYRQYRFKMADLLCAVLFAAIAAGAVAGSRLLAAASFV